MTVSLAETLFGRQLLDRVRVGSPEFSGGVFEEGSHVLAHLLHHQVPLILALFDGLVDVVHLDTVPFNFSFVIVTLIFEQNAPSKHGCILLDQRVERDLAQVAHEVLGFSALLVKDLVSIFLASAHALQLGQILSSRQLLFYLSMLVLELPESAFDVLNAEIPLFIKQVVLLKACAHLTLILLVMRGDLTLALLEDLNFKAALARPLESQVLFEFFD